MPYIKASYGCHTIMLHVRCLSAVSSSVLAISRYAYFLPGKICLNQCTLASYRKSIFNKSNHGPIAPKRAHQSLVSAVPCHLLYSLYCWCPWANTPNLISLPPGRESSPCPLAHKAFRSTCVICVWFNLNIFYSCRKYKEKDWVRLKGRHYPLQVLCVSSSTHLISLIRC